MSATSVMPVLMLGLLLSTPAAAAGAGREGEAETTTALVEQAPPTATQRPPAATPPQTPPPAPERRRRGSFVGYVGDATVESQIRVRFDAGWGNNRPDRNEFFYAQCGCNGIDKPGPSALVTDLRFQQATVEAQYGVHSRFALFAAVPFRTIQAQSIDNGALLDNQGGLSDVRAGVKGALVSTDDTLLTAQVQGYFQSGRESLGLGAGHASVEPSLLLNQKLSDRVTLESQIGDWHPINGTAFRGTQYSDDVLFYGIGPSFEVYRSGRTSVAPVVELFAWHLFGGLQVQPINAVPSGVAPADANIVNIKAGVRAAVNRNSFYIGYGRALTNAVWYTDIVRFEYRFSF